MNCSVFLKFSGEEYLKPSLYIKFQYCGALGLVHLVDQRGRKAKHETFHKQRHVDGSATETYRGIYSNTSDTTLCEHMYKYQYRISTHAACNFANAYPVPYVTPWKNKKLANSMPPTS